MENKDMGLAGPAQHFNEGDKAEEPLGKQCALKVGKKLPTAAQLTGSDPDFTGDLTTDEYIQSIRRG